MNRRNAVSSIARGHGQTAYKRSLAYARLGIDPKDVEPVPFFSANLLRLSRVVNRGRNKQEALRPLEYLQYCEDPDARKVHEAYLSVPESYRRLLPEEAFCRAAGVSPYRVLELVAGAAVRMGALASTVVAAVMHPHVLVKTIDRALQDDGVRERVLLHRASGFLSGRVGP